MKTLISFRLRKDLDVDLISLDVDDTELPELCRNGLRLMLGITTKRAVEVVERPIVVRETRQIKSKPVVFTPNNGR